MVFVNDKKNMLCSPSEGRVFMDKVKDYARVNGIVFLIDYATETSTGTAYITEVQLPDRHYKVVVQSGIFNENTMEGVYASLHEFGHWIDFQKQSSKSLNRALGRGELEVSAWVNAFRLAKEFGLSRKQLRQMEEYALYCLSTYLDGYDYRTMTYRISLRYGFKGEEPSMKEADERVKIACKKAIREARFYEKQGN